MHEKVNTILGMVIIAMTAFSQTENKSEANVDSIVLEKPLEKLKVKELKVEMEVDYTGIVCCCLVRYIKPFNDPFGQSLSFTQEEIERMTRTLR